MISDDLKELLEKTTIECDDAPKVIKRYDTKDAFHFIDPPYVGSHMGHYAGMFNDGNLKDLLNLLCAIAGKFMLTMYPSEVINDFAKSNNWHIHEVERQVSAGNVSARRKQIEWIVVNYDIPVSSVTSLSIAA